MEGKLEQERRLFETQMKTVLVDYDKLMKDNQSNSSFCFAAVFNRFFRSTKKKNFSHDITKQSQRSISMKRNFDLYQNHRVQQEGHPSLNFQILNE